jgi:hypothetical protein
MPDDLPVTIRDLYPDFTDQELEQAEANLRRYLAVLVRMAERLAAEGRSINDLGDLTDSPTRSTISNERSKSMDH